MTPFDLFLQILDISSRFYLSVKFDANIFINDRYYGYFTTSRIWLRNAYSGQCWRVFGDNLAGNRKEVVRASWHAAQLAVTDGQSASSRPRRSFIKAASYRKMVTEGHPAKSVTEFHGTTLSRKFKFSNLPIYSKTLEYFSVCNNIHVRSPALPDKPPWHLKNCNVDTSLINCGSKHNNPQLLKRTTKTVFTYTGMHQKPLITKHQLHSVFQNYTRCENY